MRKGIRILLVAGLAAALIASCGNLVMPTGIRITGSPDFGVATSSSNIDLGVQVKKFLELETTATLISDMLVEYATAEFGADMDLEIVKGSYNLADSTQVTGLVATMNLFSQPLDSLLGQEIGLDQIAIPDYTLTLPDVSYDQTYTVALSSADFGTFTLPSLGSQSGIWEADSLVDLPVPAQPITDFDAMSLADGTLSLTITPTISSGFDLSVVSARLVDGDGVVLADADSGLGLVTGGGTIGFPLAGVTLGGSIGFDITLSGANATADTYDLEFSANLSGLSIDSVSGISADSSGSETLSVTFPSELVSATVGSGTLTVTLAQPSSWTGVVSSFSSLVLTLDSWSASLGSGVTDNGDGTYTVDLAGAVLPYSSGTLEYTLSVDGSGGTIIMDDTFGVQTDLAIATFSTLVASAPGLDLTFDQVFDVDQSIIDAVTSMTFGTAEIELWITNGLPVDLDIGFDSLVLGTVSAVSFPGGSPTAQSATLDFPNKTVSFGGLIDTDSSGSVDIPVSLTVAVAGFDSGTGQLTLTDATPGASYSLSASATVNLDPSSVTLKDFGQSVPAMQLPTGMLGEMLPAGISLDTSNVATMLRFDNVNGLSLNLQLAVLGRYGNDTDGWTYIDLMDGTADDFWTLNDASATAWFADPSTYTVTAVDGSAPIYLDLAPHLVEPSFEITVYVSLTGSAIDLTSVTGNIDVSATIGLPLPLEISVANTIADTSIHGVYATVDDTSDYVWEATEDMIPRDDPELMDQLFDSLASVSLTYTLNNGLIGYSPVESGDQPAIVIDAGLPDIPVLGDTAWGDYPGNPNPGSTEFMRINFGSGVQNSVSLSQTQIQFIRDNSFVPKIKVFLPEGGIAVDPDGLLGLDIALRVETNASVYIAFNGNSGEEQ